MLYFNRIKVRKNSLKIYSQYIKDKMNKTIEVNQEYLLENLANYLDEKKNHGKQSYLVWYEEYAKEYKIAIENDDTISAYLALANIYGLFYKHRTNKEVNKALFATIDQLRKLFLKIEQKDKYLNFVKERDLEYYDECGKWNGRHCFKQAAVFYEKNKLYSQACDACQQSLDLGYLQDGTRVGMNGRLYKLKKKMNKQKEKK